MKTKIVINKIFLFILIVLISSIILFAVGNRNSHRNLFDRHVYFDYPQFSVMDDDNTIYIIDTNRRRILLADNTGELITSISEGKREEGSFYYAEKIIPASTDTFFVLNYVLDINGMFVLREELIEYDKQGNFKRIFYQRRYENRKATLVQRGEIFSPKVFQDWLYFFIIDEQQIRFIRKSTQNESSEIITSLPFEEAIAYVADIEWLDSENFLILDKRGFMTRGDIGGTMQTIYYHQDNNINSTNDGGIDFLPADNLWNMTISGNGLLYITDLINRRIVSIPLSDINSSEEDTFEVSYTVVMEPEILAAAGFSDEPFIYYQIGSAPNGFVTAYEIGVYFADTEGKFKHYQSFTLPFAEIIITFCWWLGIISGSISLTIGIFYVFTRILKGRISLMAKQSLIILPLLGGGIILIASILLQTFITQYEASNIDKLLSLTQTISQSIDGDVFYGVTNQGDYMNDSYRRIREKLRGALNYNQDSWNEGFYFALYQVINENLYGYMYLNNLIGLRHLFNWYEDPQSIYRYAYEGSVVFEQAEDISGSFLYAVAPIYDSLGQPVALLEIGSDLYYFRQNVQQVYNRTVLYMSFVGLTLIIFILLMTFLILRNLGVLRRGVERIAEGEWSHKIALKSNDEVSELGERFNYMSDSIHNYLNQIQLLNSSYQKFFPDDFLQHLDLRSVTEVKLGDQVEKNMSILFSDIRSFTSISENLTPAENFNFLNEYLKIIAPIIRKNQGFIDKYVGDAIMALFPSVADDAVKTAIDMVTNLKEFNYQQTTLPEIKIGIGIHTGKVMLGILGEQQRMEATVIADSVNFAARLESLSKHAGATIIVSEDTMNQISNQEHFLKRYLGRVQVVGKDEAMRIYEILSGLPEKELENKLRCKSMLMKGIQSFEEGDLQTALDSFSQLRKDPFNEKIATLYISCIKHYHHRLDVAARHEEESPEWNGVLHIVSK